MTVATIFAAGMISNVFAQCDACDNGCSACYSAPKCVGSAELVDVEKNCWNVECEDICVPAVRFPWECGGNKLTLFSLFKKKYRKGCGYAACTDAGCDGGCSSAGCCDGSGCSAGCKVCVPPKCGFVRNVAVLRKEKYTSQECEYSLEIQDNGGCRGSYGCDGPGCAACAKAAKTSRNIQVATATPTRATQAKVPTTKTQMIPEVNKIAALPPQPKKSRRSIIPAAFKKLLK